MPAEATKTFDDFVKCGRYVLLVGVIHEFCAFIQLSSMFFMMFGGAEATPTSCGGFAFDKNMTSTEKCRIMRGLMNETHCKPVLSAQFDSINYEFGYYCGTTKIVKQSIAVQMIGVLVGALTFGQLSDLYGRKNLLLFTIVGCLTCTLASSFTGTLFSFTVWRFVLNIFVGGNGAILHTFMIESLPKKHRFWISNIAGWSINMIFMVLLAMVAREWRALIHYTAAFSFPALILALMLHESPRFLLSKRRIDDAKEVVKKIYKFDKRELDEQQLDKVMEAELVIIERMEEKQKNYTFWHLFYTPKLTGYTLAVGLTLFTASSLNYSLLFNISRLSGNIYLNALYTAIGRYLVNLFAIALDLRFKSMGRKALHAIGEGLIVMLFCSYIAGRLGGFQSHQLLSYEIMGVICLSTLLFVTGHFLAAELYPTQIRNISFSAGQLFSRCGVIVSPLFFVLAEVHPILPYVALLLLCATDFVVFWAVMDETKDKELIDFMPPKEESWSHRLKRRSRRVHAGNYENGNNKV
ncbi:unnamed protein product [Bursaphelenchus xylophilus]|uniref:(pine wood nematode) hypothetical protein n=1 Tax=Bursaphelenchus xylophilus TaxID=6326 RepID=A0A1I7SAS0_BURXY|nr:unnamed protein product [Bursaphelenchus xylophilus]CAG9126840.1 unnamed protein product [Bursaphelenchus xylophilus]